MLAKNLVIASIAVGLGFIAISFQNCGSQAEFSNEAVISQESLQTIIDSDTSAIATKDQSRNVLIEMDLVMNQDPRTVEEPLEDVMDINEETEEITLRPEAETYLCRVGGFNSPIKKYMLCHVPAGDYDKAKTLCLPEPAIKAHLKYLKDDNPTSYMGPCK